jgi:hypothetical protein
MKIIVDDYFNCNKLFMRICFNNFTFSIDKKIIKLLNIEYNEYIDSIKLYNAILKSDYEYYFDKKENCENFINYIKQKFSNRLIYLTLIEYTEEANKLINEINKG